MVVGGVGNECCARFAVFKDRIGHPPLGQGKPGGPGLQRNQPGYMNIVPLVVQRLFQPDPGRLDHVDAGHARVRLNHKHPLHRLQQTLRKPFHFGRKIHRDHQDRRFFDLRHQA